MRCGQEEEEEEEARVEGEEGVRLRCGREECEVRTGSRQGGVRRGQA